MIFDNAINHIKLDPIKSKIKPKQHEEEGSKNQKDIKTEGIDKSKMSMPIKVSRIHKTSQLPVKDKVQVEPKNKVQLGEEKKIFDWFEDKKGKPKLQPKIPSFGTTINTTPNMSILGGIGQTQMRKIGHENKFNSPPIINAFSKFEQPGILRTQARKPSPDHFDQSSILKDDIKDFIKDDPVNLVDYLGEDEYKVERDELVNRLELMDWKLDEFKKTKLQIKSLKEKMALINDPNSRTRMNSLTNTYHVQKTEIEGILAEIQALKDLIGDEQYKNYRLFRERYKMFINDNYFITNNEFCRA